MSELSRRFFGERSVNWVAMLLVLLIVGGAAGGLYWLFRKQVGRQTGALRDQIARAEKGEGAENLDELYDRMLRFAPRDAETLEKYSKRLAKNAKTNRERANALKMLDRAVRENSSNLELRQSLVDLAILPGFDNISNPDPHLEVLRTASPKSAQPCERLAARAEARGDFGKAEALLKDALERDKTHVPSRLRLARLRHFRTNKEKEAATLVEELNRDALPAVDQMAIAEFWREIGNVEKSRVIVEEALKKFPDDPDVILASALMQEDRADKEPTVNRAETLKGVRALLERGQSIAPKRSDFYVRLAYLDLRQNRRAEAKKTIERGLAAIPGSFDLRWVKCETMLGDPIDEAKAKEITTAIAELRELEPKPELVQFLESRLAFAQKRWIEAAQGFEKAAPLLARDRVVGRQTLLLLGAAYRELGEPTLREMAYRRLLAVEPLNVEASHGLGQSLAEQGRYADAIGMLAPIYRRVPVADQPRLATTLLISLVRRETGKEASKRNWTEVDRLLDEVGSKDPSNRLIVELRVERLAAENNFDDALKFVDAYLALVKGQAEGDQVQRKANLAEAYKTKAILYLRKNDVAKARATSTEARKEAGDSVAVRLAEAAAECATGFPKDLKTLDSLGANVDTFSDRERLALFRTLAAIRQSMGDETGALSLFSRAVAVNPQDQSLQRTRFLLALDLGDFKQAEEAADALAKSNASPGSPSMCAKALLELRDEDRNPDRSKIRRQAVNLIGCEKHYDSWSGVARAVGRVAELEDKKAEAVKHYSAAFDPRAPNYRIARRLLFLNERTANYLEARKWLAASRLDAADVETLRVAAEVAVRTGGFAEARTLVERAAPPSSKDPETAIWAGVLLQAAQDPIAAEKQLRRAIELAPTQGRPVVVLIEMLSRQGRVADARKELEAAEKRVPAADVPLLKARCEEALGDVAAAKSTLEKALAKSPTDLATLRAATEFYVRTLDFPRALDATTRLEKAAGARADQRAWATRMRGVMLVVSGKTEEARKTLDQIDEVRDAKKESGEDVKYDLRTRAMIMAVQPSTKSWRDALAELSRLESLGMSDASDQLIAAQLEENLGLWSDAKRRLTSLADRTKNGNPRVLARIAKGMLDHDEPSSETELWLKRLERLAPNDGEALYLRARLLHRSNPADAADFVAKKTVEKRFNDLAAGLMLVELGNDAAAEPYFKRAAGEPSASAPQQALAAMVQWIQLKSRAGRFRDTGAEFRSLQSTLPPATYAQIMLEAIYATAEELPIDRISEFSTWLAGQIKAAPNDRALRMAAAGVESRLGKHAKALELLTRLKEETPESDPMYAAVLNNVSFLIAFVEKKPDVAQKMLAENIAKGQSPLELRDTLAVVRLEQGGVDEALNEFQELSRLSPKAVTYFHLARAQAKKGDAKSAKASLEKAMKLRLRVAELHELERPSFEELRAELKL
jgi:tetratricopeptide (TPR) repeat protein